MEYLVTFYDPETDTPHVIELQRMTEDEVFEMLETHGLDTYGDRFTEHYPSELFTIHKIGECVIDFS